ncbi:MAG: IPTL-CTERM sorting domain-containing protein [Planctomycetes bacterium]|nr:IPTL-CTERM sorting domain-containing protein [Planctomycetota bacterium]
MARDRGKIQRGNFDGTGIVDLVTALVFPTSIAIDFGCGAFDCQSNGIGDDCEQDSDGDGVIDDCDGCPADVNKTIPGTCGCGVSDDDSDGDTVADCEDECPEEDDTVDLNGNDVPDCLEPLPIPTVSEWGLALFGLALLALAKFHFGRRHGPDPA